MPLFVLFVAVPIIEIALFIQVGGWIGMWPTLAIVVLTAIAGTALMRSQGARAWAEVQRSFAEMRDPTRPLAHGVMILVAGVLLLTPGFFTDTIGLLLLVPSIRDAVMRQLAARVRIGRMQMQATGRSHDAHRAPYGDGVIDGDYAVEPPGKAARTERPPHEQPDDIPGQSGPGRGNPSGWTRH